MNSACFFLDIISLKCMNNFTAPTSKNLTMTFQSNSDNNFFCFEMKCLKCIYKVYMHMRTIHLDSKKDILLLGYIYTEELCVVYNVKHCGMSYLVDGLYKSQHHSKQNTAQHNTVQNLFHWPFFVHSTRNIHKNHSKSTFITVWHDILATNYQQKVSIYKIL